MDHNDFLARSAALPYKSNLNDNVIINTAPCAASPAGANGLRTSLPCGRNSKRGV
jgi:hypothetical protein